MRSCGIGARRNLHMIPQAIDRHLSVRPGTHPNDAESVEFRARFAPETVTGRTEAEAALVRTGAIRLVIRYMGLWDTVRSFSVFGAGEGDEAKPARWSTWTYFHDNRLSSMVMEARHAMALDERRRLFRPLAWSNLDALNALSGRAAEAPFRQLWFPGDHGSVGGGGNRVGLSSVALRWVALGAARAGLRLMGAELRRQAWHMDPVGERLQNRLVGGLLYALQDDRRGPARVEDLSAAALDRWAAGGYAGRPLRQVRGSLGAMEAEARERLRAAVAARDGATHVAGSPWWIGGEEAQVETRA
jgi:hypothetical protein